MGEGRFHSYVSLPEKAHAQAWWSARQLFVGSPLHGWSRSDILALAGVVVAVLVAVMPPVRRWLLHRWRAMLVRAGVPRRRYERWFVRRWGKYANPYLDDVEYLDLSNTYISLTFHSAASDAERRIIANQVLRDVSVGNLVITGAPGSGKSTLLKAYGVNICNSSRPRSRHDIAHTPFLVQLRKFAKFADRPGALFDYLVEIILVSDVGMSREQARQSYVHPYSWRYRSNA